MLQIDVDEEDAVGRNEKNPTWRHALVVVDKLTDHLPASPRVTSETLFRLWQFLTSAHDDVVLLYDIADSLTGEPNGHKDFHSAEMNR